MIIKSINSASSQWQRQWHLNLININIFIISNIDINIINSSSFGEKIFKSDDLISLFLFQFFSSRNNFPSSIICRFTTVFNLLRRMMHKVSWDTINKWSNWLKYMSLHLSISTLPFRFLSVSNSASTSWNDKNHFVKKEKSRNWNQVERVELRNLFFFLSSPYPSLPQNPCNPTSKTLLSVLNNHSISVKYPLYIFKA